MKYSDIENAHKEIFLKEGLYIIQKEIDKNNNFENEMKIILKKIKESSGIMAAGSLFISFLESGNGDSNASITWAGVGVLLSGVAYLASKKIRNKKQAIHKHIFENSGLKR